MMSDQTADSLPTPPPRGDEQKGEKYLKTLIGLITTDKVKVVHTDLNKFDPSNLYDHYRIDVKDYQIEVSHSKQANTGADSFVLIFTNLKNVQEGTCEKVILAYTDLSAEQFQRFKHASDEQLEKVRKAEEEKRFNAALEPLDQTLEELYTSPQPEPEDDTPPPAIHNEITDQPDSEESTDKLEDKPFETNFT